MKKFVLLVVFLAAGTCCFGQQWEVGVLGGGGFLSKVNVSGPSGSATAGFDPGFAAGVFLGQNLYRHLGGEIRYEYLQSNLNIKSGGQKASFDGQAHAVHYDLIVHTGRKESRAEVYAAVGVGLKVYRGTGASQAYQPLYQYGFLTHTQQLKPMASVGGGVKVAVAKRVFFRAELRDFITSFPSNVIAAPTGVKYGSILHDFVPMGGLSYEF